jgi:hypothetical protein
VLFFAPWVVRRSQRGSIDINVGLVVLQDIFIFKYVHILFLSYAACKQKEDNPLQNYKFSGCFVWL